jgi:polyhydroxybutyrate depolymerase
LVFPQILLAMLGCEPGLAIPPDPCREPLEAGWHRLDIPGSWRPRPLIYVPATTGPRDLVVALHGNNATAEQFAQTTRLPTLADLEGFAVVFPQGLGLQRSSWNAGPSCCGEANWLGLDDVAYLDLVTATAASALCGRKVLATGFSNGAMMLQRWSCEGHGPDAIAPATGPFMADPARCAQQPVPVRVYHGRNDTRIPADGGRGDRGTYDFRSVEQTMAVHRERNRCTDSPPRQQVSGDTTCFAWQCEASTVLCLVDTAVHSWPGGRNHTRSNAGATGAVWTWFGNVVPR